MCRSSGSPLSSVDVNFFASSSVMCGGSGGTSGSVFTSSTTGRSAASASSHAAPSRFGIIDVDALETDQLGELVIRDVRNLLRGVELRIALHDALLPGHLVQILVVEDADDPALVRPVRASISRR